MVAKKTVHEKVIREVIEKPAKKKSSKKKTKKKTSKKKSSPKKSLSDERIERALIENFISLQKVMVNLSVKFDSLSNQISKLLELFEISAKALAEKEFVTDKEKKDNRDVIQKMDEVIDQNKILARGMTLMHDRISEQEEMPFTQPSQPKSLPMMPRPLPSMRPSTHEMQKPKPLPSMKSQQKPSSPLKPLPSQSKDTYQKSISSNNNDSNQRQNP